MRGQTSETEERSARGAVAAGPTPPRTHALEGAGALVPHLVNAFAQGGLLCAHRYAQAVHRVIVRLGGLLQRSGLAQARPQLEAVQRAALRRGREV